MKKINLSKKVKIIISVVSVLLVALIVTGAFLLSGGTVKENVLTGKKVSLKMVLKT